MYPDGCQYRREIHCGADAVSSRAIITVKEYSYEQLSQLQRAAGQHDLACDAEQGQYGPAAAVSGIAYGVIPLGVGYVDRYSMTTVSQRDRGYRRQARTGTRH